MKQISLTILVSVLSIIGFSAQAEVFRMAGFAEFYECRKSLGNNCSLNIDKEPNVDIPLAKISENPAVWKGSVTRDHSQLGIEAIVEIIVEKTINPRLSNIPQYGVSARVRKKNGTVLVPWFSATFDGEPSRLNAIAAHGPEYDNLTPDLYKAKMFLYLDQPLRRGQEIGYRPLWD